MVLHLSSELPVVYSLHVLRYDGSQSTLLNLSLCKLCETTILTIFKSTQYMPMAGHVRCEMLYIQAKQQMGSEAPWREPWEKLFCLQISTPFIYFSKHTAVQVHRFLSPTSETACISALWLSDCCNTHIHTHTLLHTHWYRHTYTHEHTHTKTDAHTCTPTYTK